MAGEVTDVCCVNQTLQVHFWIIDPAVPGPVAVASW
jgi:hypothetical protein